MGRLITKAAVGLLAGAALLASAVAARAAGDHSGYVMTAFTNASQSNMYVYQSDDGSTFRLKKPLAYTPPSGLIRDPSVIKHADGYWWVVYTTDWDGQTIGLARSRDLESWEHVRDVTIPVEGVTNTWAPEWFRDADGKVHVVVSLSKNGRAGQFEPHYLTALDGGFARWSAPRRLSGLGPNYIDTFILRDGGQLHAFAKNETTKFIEHAVAPSIDGPWTVVGSGDWAGWGDKIEGPALAKLPDGAWRIWFDEYEAKRYWSSDSRDLRRWSPKTELAGLTGVARHFTVARADGRPMDAATPAPPKPQVHQITWDDRSLMIDGKRTLIWSGEMHPYRLPSPDQWRDVLQKMKASGYNTVAFYFNWGYHSPERGVYDFTGVRDMDRLLTMAKYVGLYVIVRPGPYMNAEVTRGGFPSWLVLQSARARTDHPEYLEAAEEWLTAINGVLKKHQLSDGGGTVILYQIENELAVTGPSQVRYMQRLYDKVRADGITVPIFHNDQGRNGYWTPANSDVPGVVHGPVDLYAFDGYPGGVCQADATPGAPNAAPDWGIYGPGGARGGASASPRTPGFVAEFGGGWFDYWGSNGTYPCTAERQGSGYERVFYGTNLANALTIQSFYMTHGGTSWGWMPAPVVYSSYDYGAALDEARGIRPKLRTMKQLGHFVDRLNPILANMTKASAVRPSSPRVKVYHNRDEASGVHLYLAMHNPSSATTDDPFSFELVTADRTYKVPQAGVLRIKGQDAKWLIADYDLERQRLVYSTSELQTHLRQDERDVALFYGRAGEDGETVFRYGSAPRVEVLEGQAQHVFDAASGDLRLNYRHGGLIRVRITGGGRPPLLLLVGDVATAETFWRQETASGASLQRGPYLIRTATVRNGVLALTGDTEAETPLEVWAPRGVRRVSWNGASVAGSPTPSGSWLARGVLPGPAAVALPDLAKAQWRRRAESPEAQPGFDDSAWQVADKRSTPGPTKPPTGHPVLTMDDYGFHHGDVWYRGRYESDGVSDRLSLHYGAGGAGMVQVWIDGRFIGQHELATGIPFPITIGTAEFTVPEDLRGRGPHVVSVMVRNNGHNWDLFADDAHKEGRGLIHASLGPSGGRTFAVPITWRVQGNRGGQDIADPARGVFNNGGLFGEREGWHLPGFPDRGWEAVTVPDATAQAGATWYRTEVALDLPKGHDTAVGLTFGDPATPRSRGRYRVLVFVNGWHMGQFASNVGPQRTFVVPTGVLNPNGRNTIALAVTGDGAPDSALEAVNFVNLRTVRGGVPVRVVAAPAYASVN
jgi:beta-galactosidase GanA